MKTLELNQMGIVNAGGDIWSDKSSCNEWVQTLGGVSTIMGLASWWTGAGAGASFALSGFTYAWSLRCASL